MPWGNEGRKVAIFSLFTFDLHFACLSHNLQCDLAPYLLSVQLLLILQIRCSAFTENINSFVFVSCLSLIKSCCVPFMLSIDEQWIFKAVS